MWKRSIGYEIQELLGEGSQGRVYKALRRDPAGGISQTVAVKILHSETAVESWKSEFDSLAKVRSPYCVQVFGFERLNGSPALVLEYVDGVSLFQLGKNCWLEEENISEILAQTEAALLDLYKSGVFHGDLSPHNILIGADGRLRLLDFGLANCGGKIARATVEFAAPERLCGEPATLAADIFSLGRIEQFLRGISPAPDRSSPYLQPRPEMRSLRGFFPCDDKSTRLGEKVRAFQARQKLAREMKTRTQFMPNSFRRPRAILASFTACLLLAVSGGARGISAPGVSLLQIQTNRWHYFQLDGNPVGYSPVHVPLEAGKTVKLEWRNEKESGVLEIPVRSGRIYRFSDRDFSH